MFLFLSFRYLVYGWSKQELLVLLVASKNGRMASLEVETYRDNDVLGAGQLI